MKRILSLLMAALLCCVPALAENASDYPVADVNGEILMYSEYYSIESAYLYQVESAGADLTDATVYAYFQDLALTYAIEQMLVRQDMQAQGCYDFTEEEEAWFAQTGQSAYAAALEDVKASLRSSGTSEDEVEVYALAYAKSLGVTEQTYVDYFRDQYAAAKYYAWLTRDNLVTDADVQAAYDERVAQSKALYENDVAAFETALDSGVSVWYKPEGYRSMLQILLPAQGDTAEARLASVQKTVDEINARLAQGESFQSLIALYGADANFSDESFLNTGYQVHQDSVIWEDAFISAAFAPGMTAPGSVSEPFVSDLGVHILYYLCDSSAGPVALTEDVRDALTATLYTERYTAAQSERINALADAAQITIY